ncbi:ABC transporter substrate-binding protein [Devosia sp. WQ 349]|uniref:ABC transporter substrate-binding protein n=1 Tax=Devosia sp. WQ 349K1 TaxID=2800329 RepID=UPI001907D1F5|nr:ABC transporter substrate-binding protein [Devosia sp. WQ 349K1]MBK1795497.1 ABC transporter substrate-binding protein [Devosia sp. WQ 349K1]
MKKLICLTAAALCATTSIATAQELEAFRFGTVAAKGDAGFVYMVGEDGFDDYFGLDVDIQAFKGDAILLRGLLAGELDAYIGNPGGPMIAAAQGADVKVIGCPWPGLTYGLFTKPEITSINQLKGGSIGVSAPGSLPDLFARAVVLAAGMSLDDVEFTVAGSDAERVAAVSADIIAAAPSSSEFEVKAPELGLHMLVHARDVVPQYTRFCLMTRGDLIKERPEFVAKFLAAQMKGFQFALDNKDATIALSYDKAELPADDKAPLAIFEEVVANDAVDPSMTIDIDKLRWLSNLLVDTGNMTAGYDPTNMVDTTVIDAAQALLAAQ